MFVSEEEPPPRAITPSFDPSVPPPTCAVHAPPRVTTPLHHHYYPPLDLRKNRTLEFLIFIRSAQQLEQHRDAEKNAEFRATAKRTAGVRVGARSQLHMVVVCVLPLDIADGVARRAERECVGVNVVGDARGPVVCPLCVAGLTPVVAAVV